MTGSPFAPSADSLTPGGHIPVKISLLITDEPTEFDLYLPPEDSGPPVLYCEANVPLTKVERSRLLASGVETLYILASDLRKFRRYTEAHLGALLRRDDLESRAKLNLLYDSAHGLMADVFEDPRSGETIGRSRQLVEHTVGYMLEQGDVLEDLLHVMAYDYHIYTHSINVCVFGLSLALRSGITDLNTLKEFGDALLLHDVGKSEVDPEIVNCPGKLTEKQFEEMKMHTVYGYEILSGHAELSPMVLDVTRHHHEKLHGRGYPDGLSEERISKFVRISTIADIFDALTTLRVYKSAVPSFEALKLMRAEESKGLDPEYFRAFVQMLGSAQRT